MRRMDQIGATMKDPSTSARSLRDFYAGFSLAARHGSRVSKTNTRLVDRYTVLGQAVRLLSTLPTENLVPHLRVQEPNSDGTLPPAPSDRSEVGHGLIGKIQHTIGDYR